MSGPMNGLMNGPCITPEDLDANILETHFLNAGHAVVMSGNSGDFCHERLDLLTICVLVLLNGFVVTGESACAAPENYDRALGEKIALANAKAKIWPLMGYELLTRIQEERGGL